MSSATSERRRKPTKVTAKVAAAAARSEAEWSSFKLHDGAVIQLDPEQARQWMKDADAEKARVLTNIQALQLNPVTDTFVLNGNPNMSAAALSRQLSLMRSHYSFEKVDLTRSVDPPFFIKYVLEAEDDSPQMEQWKEIATRICSMYPLQAITYELTAQGCKGKFPVQELEEEEEEDEGDDAEKEAEEVDSDAERAAEPCIEVACFTPLVWFTVKTFELACSVYTPQTMEACFHGLVIDASNTAKESHKLVWNKAFKVYHDLKQGLASFQATSLAQKEEEIKRAKV
jgi:hypothetical protein